MLNEAPRERSPPPPEHSGEDSEGKAAVMRPVAVRLAPSARGKAADSSASGLLNRSRTGSLGNHAQHQHKSAWARYETHQDSRSQSPQAKSGSPAGHPAQLRRELQREQSVESGEPGGSLSPPAQRQGQPGAARATTAGAPAHFDMQAAYLSSLKAAIVANLGRGEPSRAAPASPTFQQSMPGQALRKLKSEPVDPANGSLSILPEPAGTRGRGGYPSPQPAQPAAALNPALNPQANLAHIVRQQLEELLRGQAGGGSGSQLPAVPPEPHMYGAAQPSQASLQPSASYPGYPPRFGSHDMLRPAGLFSGSAESDSFQADASAARATAPRRWNSTASAGAEPPMFPAPAGWGAAGLHPGLIQHLSSSDGQALLQALQMLCQANEMAAVANSRIQAFSMAASANLEAACGMRKRKAADYFEDSGKRHNSGNSEPDNFPYGGSHQQVCAECGTTNTPTWRRSGRRLMCNACGLRRSRSIRSARNNSSGAGASAAVAAVSLPKRELM